MNAAAETRSVVIERDIPHKPEKLWRALTQPHLIQEWLMKNDFTAVVGHKFNLRGDWGGVLDCEVLEVEPNRKLAYTWNHAHATCAWSRWASARNRSRPRAAPNSAGNNSSRTSKRFWPVRNKEFS
jgi:uncharacterized protein YndB with AHSA1/START domain